MAVDDKQQRMLEFESSWYRLGGGSSDEISRRFGLSDRDFFDEVDRLLTDAPPAALSASQVSQMHSVVRRRRWMAS